MDQSALLMSAKVQFVEAKLRLVHIPLDKYDSYIPTILKLLFPPTNVQNNEDPDHAYVSNSWANKHAFLNLSVTPLECSIVCDTGLAQSLFEPAFRQAPSRSSDDHYPCSISSEDFVVISVEGAGMEAGQRVLELTSPLALAGISLFFISTYFSDYILVPAKAKGQVVCALEDRGFTFEKSSKTYVNPSAHHRQPSSGSSHSGPSTPPPHNVTELQARTFALLERNSIIPRVDHDIRLVQCAGRNANPETIQADELALQHGLTKSLLHQPHFLSLTLTQDEAASLLLEQRLMANWDMSGGDSVLLGAKDESLIPITLDLGQLSLDASGIVCGVAGRLVDGPGVLQPIDMNYLSTARAGTVMVNEIDLLHAMEALRLGADGAIQP